MALEVAGSKLVARPKIFFKRLRLTLGCRQAVRHGILIPAFVGSNPATPAKQNSQVRLPHPSQTKFAGSAATPKPNKFAGSAATPKPNKIRRFGCCRPKSVLPPSDFGRKVPQQGPLAQMVEHLTFNQGVPGSNPGWTTTFDFKNRIR